MKKIAVFFANGFEEAEALVPVDMFVRSEELDIIKVLVDDVDDKPVCINRDYYEVEGSRGVNLSCKLSERVVLLSKSSELIDSADALFFPGGLRCAKNLSSSPRVSSFVKKFYKQGKVLAAICASPAAVLAKNGAVNKDTKGVCYPGTQSMSGIETAEEFLSEKFANRDGVCVSGNVITARGAGVAFQFAFELIKTLCSDDTSKKVSSQVLY